MLGHLGAISSYLGSMLGHFGGKMHQDSDQEHQVEPNISDWRLPDGRVALGWRVNERVWGPTVYSSLIATKLQDPKIQNSKTLSLQEDSIDSKTLSLNFEDSS